MKSGYFLNVLSLSLILFIYSCKKGVNDTENLKENTKISIEDRDLDYHLNNAMVDLENNTGIGDSLSQDVYLKSFGFYENEENKYTLILELNDDVTSDIIEKYTFSIELHVFEKDKDLLMPYSKSKGRQYDLRPFKPELISVNKHKYVTEEMAFEMKTFDKIVFYLYPRSGYNGKVSGKRLQLLDYSL